jgi:hypothetical protein
MRNAVGRLKALGTVISIASFRIPENLPCGESLRGRILVANLAVRILPQHKTPEQLSHFSQPAGQLYTLGSS